MTLQHVLNLPLLKQAENEWPYPLALTCRSLRVKSNWQEAQGVACHLFELVLRHSLALVLVDYGQLKYPSERLASYLMHQAYRSRLTCGSLIAGLREVTPYLAGYPEHLILPELMQALAPDGDFTTIDRELLTPLNRWRNQWSHPKGHVAYTPPRESDVHAFCSTLMQLLERLNCLGRYTLLYTQQLTRTADGWQQSALLLQGPMEPFETVNHTLSLTATPPESHSLVLAVPHSERLWPLSPFYMARSEASGHCELAALIHIHKKRCHWDPDWPAQQDGAAHNAYVAWMERYTLPERPTELAEEQPVAQLEAQPEAPASAAPHFRNATWRMFAMDWSLTHTELQNQAHYDALLRGQQVLAIWRYVPEENAYLLGVRPRLAQHSEPALTAATHQPLPGCPALYQQDFAPEHGGHWHHSHYRWAYVPHQDALGGYLEHCDTVCGNAGGTLL